MDASLIVAFGAIGGNILLGAGLAATWVRNGRSSAIKYGELKSEVEVTGKAVNNLTEVVREFQLETVETIATQGEKISGAEKDIVTIFNNMERRKQS